MATDDELAAIGRMGWERARLRHERGELPVPPPEVLDFLRRLNVPPAPVEVTQ